MIVYVTLIIWKFNSCTLNLNFLLIFSKKNSFTYFQVEHPAAKMIAMAAGMMQQEVGDGTNFVVLLCGALLKEAEDLIRMGLKPVDVIEGNECLKVRKLRMVQGTFLSQCFFVHRL